MSGEALATFVAVCIAEQNFVTNTNFADIFAGVHDYSSACLAMISITDGSSLGLEPVFLTFMSEDSWKLSRENARRTR